MSEKVLEKFTGIPIVNSCYILTVSGGFILGYTNMRVDILPDGGVHLVALRVPTAWYNDHLWVTISGIVLRTGPATG